MKRIDLLFAVALLVVLIGVASIALGEQAAAPLPIVPQASVDDLKMQLGECAIIQFRAVKQEAAYVARIRELEAQVAKLTPKPAEAPKLPAESKPK